MAKAEPCRLPAADEPEGSPADKRLTLVGMSALFDCSTPITARTSVPAPTQYAIPPRSLLAAILALVIGVSSADAQLRPLVIKDARVISGGREISQASIKISGSTIEQVRPGIKTGFLTRTIDAAGKTVTPGLIDCWSSLGLDWGGLGAANVTALSLDAFDRYARDQMLEALSQGVTTVFVGPPSADGLRGMGSVVRVTPLGTLEDRTMISEAALCATVGVSSGAGPIARVMAVQDLRKKLRTAKEHREAKEDYEEDLEEYEKKLQVRREKEEKEAEAGEEGGETEEQESGKPKAAEEGEKDKGKENDKAKGDKKDKDEIKKPSEPARDPQSDLLLRVLDGELPLRIEAHRPEDILNVLAVAEEFSIKVILVGASGGHLVADEIVAADIPVILGGTVRTAEFENDAYRYHSPRNAAKLADAGVEVYISGGGGAASTRFVALNASLAVGHGLDRAVARSSITHEAARLLGIDNRVGRIKPGMEADLVIWSGDPFSPEAKVDKVLIGGVVVYDASKETRMVTGR